MKERGAPAAVEHVSDGATRSRPVDRQRLLAVLIGLGTASTTVHYGHNFVMAEMYPPVPYLFPTALSYRIGIAVSVPVATALVLWGYREYVRGRYDRARWALIAYSPLGMSTPGHFLGGVPHIEPFFFATIFTDFATGLSVLLFALLAVPRAGTDRAGAHQ